MLIALSRHPFEWDVIPLIIPLTREVVLSLTVYKGQCVEDLAAYLDSLYCPGILRKLAEIRLKEISPLLEEVLILDELTRRILADPRRFFNTKDTEEARGKAVDRFIQVVNKHSPQHVIRAMMAYINFGLEEYQEAISQADFAQCEKEVTNFGDKIGERGDEADEAMLRRAEHLAKLLIDLVEGLRRVGQPENCLA